MMNEIIKNITETVEGYPVKNLKWNQLDNIIVGFVQCPVTGNPNIREGFICCTWRKTGKPTNHFKGREDLVLNMNYGNS